MVELASAGLAHGVKGGNPSEVGLATNSPQSETDPSREMRKTAGYRGLLFCGKFSLKQLFVSVTII
jgi:hypothetical protein